MSLIEQARKDWLQITSNTNEFGIELKLFAPNGDTAVVNGLHTKHHLGVDTDGRPVNSRNAHITISESLLNDANYPVRDASGKVNLRNHKVQCKDSTGLTGEYIIREWFPDETVGVITCILGEFNYPTP